MRGVFSWLSLYLMGLVWFLTAGVFALFSVANPNTIKDTLAENNTYQKLIPAALEIAQNDNGDNGRDSIPLDEPGIQAAISNSFPADDLQTKSETVVDSVFVWLEGKTDRPKFQLDFTNNKQVLASEVGTYTEKRAADLPKCTLQDLQAAQSSDVFTIKCLPPGVTASQAGREASQKIASSQEFLKNPVVNSDTFNNNGDGLGNQQFNAEPLRDFYQNKSLLSWLLPVLVVILAIAGILLAPDKMRAIKRLSRIFLMSAISLGIIAVVLYFAGSKLSLLSNTSNLSSDMVGPVVSDLIQHAMVTYIWFAVISLVLSIGLLVVNKRLGTTSALK